ncbi:ubiquitin-protein ligase, partial [Trifolium medium]|nr:ubiquitin-protein ligase [Trifolium medium]
LPQEIIELISKKITIYADYLRFRCVCRTWNSPVPKIPLHLPPQLPWLMLSPNSFFNLSTNKIHRVNLPIPFGPTRICGSSHGWLVVLNYTPELSLLNPITRATISLPSLQTFPNLVADLCDYKHDNLYLIKVVLSSSPSLSDDDFVVFAILNLKEFVFCKKGYDSWVRLRVRENHYRWTDAVYKNGSFYVTSMNGQIAVCDIEGSQVFLHENISISHYFISMCYTVLAGEDMLLVKQSDDMRSTVTGFAVFKMNWNVLEWEEIQTLGEYSLFIGKNSS